VLKHSVIIYQEQEKNKEKKRPSQPYGLALREV